MINHNYLGIDVGSISINFVLIDKEQKVVFESYLRGGGNPVLTVKDGLRDLCRSLPREAEIAGVGVTGSGRELIGAMVGADLVKNEISAHARAAIKVKPDVSTVIEIGGQDSKVTIIRNGQVVDFAMNLVCAAGTGSFLDSQARRLNLDIREFSAIAMESENPTAIAGRCTVFAESDMIHKQQVGHAQKDIIMGLCMALARNFTGNVCRGKELKPPFLFQGGVSANQGIRRAFEKVLGHEIIIPEHNMVMGAWGAAILVCEAEIKQTKFRGGRIAEHQIDTRAFTCTDCTNNCEIIEIIDSNEVIGRSGSRCRKW
ncbi:MAG TPA: 2-hydroxyglutaryl-CoA dehydratase [Spirochaetia bacterium]|nr:2-hydroxyglutaryl-CoA dehydratase [Spirochaetia bacterium]